MAYHWQRWMADEFRAAGLNVVEIEGWKNRGRPASTGDYDPDEGNTNHHTGTTSSNAVPAPSLQTLIVGRSDLPGPLAPWAVGFDGTVYVIAAGRCNHAGRVGKTVPFAALGADGNALFMGDEIMTNGTQDMPPAQRHAVAVTNAVYLKHFGLPVSRIHRHQDISGTGKWDLGSLSTQQLRDDAKAALSDLEDDMASPEVLAQLDRIERKIDKGREASRNRDLRLAKALADLADEDDVAALKRGIRAVRADLAKEPE